VSLVNLWRYRYMFDDSPLEKELEKEIIELSSFIDKNYKFIETEETYTRHVKRLEWIGD